ncbi:MAG: DHHW family protein [Verrucomicrobiota bacterium]
MSKKYSRFITALFCLLIFGGMAAILFTPKRTFSPIENRALQPFPTLSVNAILSGAFMSQFETYITDQFPARDVWVDIKARTQRLSGRSENNGVYFAKQDTLIPHFEAPDYDLITQNLGHVEGFSARVDVPVYFALIPGAAEIWADRLPEGAPSAPSVHVGAGRRDTPSPILCDTWPAFTAHKDEYLYYRTDHHWTSLGAYYGYAALIEAVGL